MLTYEIYDNTGYGCCGFLICSWRCNYRLNMSQSFTQSSAKSTPRKRRRTDVDTPLPSYIEETQSQASSYASSGQVFGCVEVSEVDEKGKYVKVKNNANVVCELQRIVIFL